MRSNRYHMERLKQGMVVQYFKGEDLDRSAGNMSYLYKIIGIAEHTEIGENLVIYQALYNPYAMFVKPYSKFTSVVNKEKYPKVKQHYIFEEFKLK